MRVAARARLVGWTAIAVVMASAALVGCQPTPNDTPTGDGLTQPNAGASCWGIKQAFPASTDGIYWLLTPAMDRPLQVYCDMTTSGGGWMLVARGREGWSFKNTGQGTPGQVRTTVTGSGAFAPAALSQALVNGLLNGAAVNGLPDGIRVERATSTTGTTWHNMYLFPAATTWTWSLPAGQRLTKIRLGTTDYPNGNTKDTGASFYDYPASPLQGASGTSRLRTYASSSNNWLQGWGFGTGMTGSTSSTSYLYRVSGGFTLPFSRIWLRPQIANGSVTFPVLPANGFTADPNPPGLKNTPEPMPFGVVGLNHTNEDTLDPWNTTVNVLKVHGDRVFVGGRFTGVQQGPSGATTAQGSLAAFDLDGNWISSFHPTIAGRVWDMTFTPDGKLIIGGDFTSVNGQPNTAGLAALDPTTGDVITAWHVNVSHTSQPMRVRGLDQRNGWIYVTGRFNRVQGGTWNQITVSNAISVNTTNGDPGTWKPVLSGTGVRVRAAAAGDRVYLAGYFNAINGDTNQGYHGITDAATGVPSAGVGPYLPSAAPDQDHYQQAVAESGNEILVGGAEHTFQAYDRNRQNLLYSTITQKGGDSQAIETFGGYIYLGCHCPESIFQGTNSWPDPAGFFAVDPVSFVSRFDAATHQYDTSWYPASLKGVQDEGVWTIDQDSRGCVWVGGDLIQGAASGVAANDWLGGFGRFCPTDSTVPTTPTGLTTTPVGSGLTVSWNPATDASGAVTYDVYRNNRVIATVGGTSFTDPTVTGAVRYTVRAVDSSGNRSASPAPILVTGPAPVLATPIGFGSTWHYRGDGVDQGTAWRVDGFDDSSWASGAGTFGWGAGTEATVINGAPLTSYYRTTLPIASLTGVKVLDLDLLVNAGAVVYVNGVEAGRINMPAGPVTAATPAAAYICCSEEARIKSLTVPASLLHAGSNRVAVELHAWAPAAGRALFDLKASLLGDSGDTANPGAPGLTAAPDAGQGGIDLAWTPVTDNVELGGYLVTRNGQPLAVVGPTTTTWQDRATTPGSSYSYVVTAFDANGNTAASPTRTAIAPANPQLLTFASTWRWYYQDVAPTGSWTTAGYDDTAWSAGAGELGFGDASTGTIISSAPAPRPLVGYFRRTVDIANPASFTSIRLDLIRNSGAAVYVNGIEIARDNLPAGPLTPDTFASGPIASGDRHVPVSFAIPSSAFVAGTNTIAVEVHLNSRNQTAAGFDLALTGQP